MLKNEIVLCLQEEGAYDKPEDYYEELNPLPLANTDRYEELCPSSMAEVAPPRPADDMIGIYDNVNTSHKI